MYIWVIQDISEKQKALYTTLSDLRVILAVYDTQLILPCTSSYHLILPLHPIPTTSFYHFTQRATTRNWKAITELREGKDTERSPGCIATRNRKQRHQVEKRRSRCSSYLSSVFSEEHDVEEVVSGTAERRAVRVQKLSSLDLIVGDALGMDEIYLRHAHKQHGK